MARQRIVRRDFIVGRHVIARGDVLQSLDNAGHQGCVNLRVGHGHGGRPHGVDGVDHKAGVVGADLAALELVDGRDGSLRGDQAARALFRKPQADHAGILLLGIGAEHVADLAVQHPPAVVAVHEDVGQAQYVQHGHVEVRQQRACGAADVDGAHLRRLNRFLLRPQLSVVIDVDRDPPFRQRADALGKIARVHGQQVLRHIQLGVAQVNGLRRRGDADQGSHGHQQYQEKGNSRLHGHSSCLIKFVS